MEIKGVDISYCQAGIDYNKQIGRASCRERVFGLV